MMVKNILQKIDFILSNSMKIVVIFVSIMATMTMLLQVISRYVFEISISGLDELTGHTAVWLYLMGAAYGAYEKSHIKADMVHLVIKNEKLLICIRAFSMAVAVFVSACMTVWSFDYIRWSISRHEITPSLQIPTAIFQISILVGAALMMLYFTIELLEIMGQTTSAKQIDKRS